MAHRHSIWPRDATYSLCHDLYSPRDALYGPQTTHTAPAMPHMAQRHPVQPLGRPICPQDALYCPEMPCRASHALYSPRILYTAQRRPIWLLGCPVCPRDALYGPETPCTAPAIPYMVPGYSLRPRDTLCRPCDALYSPRRLYMAQKCPVQPYRAPPTPAQDPIESPPSIYPPRGSHLL